MGSCWSWSCWWWSVLIGVWMTFNRIVRNTVETQATASLNTPTKSGGAERFNLRREGRFGRHRRLVAARIHLPQMVSLGGLNVAVSYGQLRKDPITVDQIVIDKPNLVIQQAAGSSISRC